MGEKRRRAEAVGRWIHLMQLPKYHWKVAMGNQQTPPSGGWLGPVPPNAGPETSLPTPSAKLDKGDYCQLKASKRKFRIIDERKDSDNNFEELCKFDDDSRRPVWLPHTWLVGEVNILEKA